jgi:hypothetical protein
LRSADGALIATWHDVATHIRGFDGLLEHHFASGLR